MSEKSKNFGLLNPLQCDDAIQNKQIVFNAEFSKITEANLRNDDFKENSPHKIMGKFSRFKVSVLDGSSVTTNLKVKQIPAIVLRTKFAANKHFEAEYQKQCSNDIKDADTSGSVSSAYTTKFSFGDYKGMSPAEVILGFAPGTNVAAEWNNTYKMYSKNVEAHPENKAIMDAMTETYELYKNGTLSKDIIYQLKENLAYSTKFISGNMKGKTPAQILIEDADGVNKLTTQREYLSKNVDKYPNNKVIIDAIDIAISLKNSGKLSNEKTEDNKTRVFEILPEVPKPNIYKTVMVGNVEMHPTHSMHIYCNVGAKYPITIEIKNYNCPVETVDNGGINAIISQMDKNSYKSAEINLSIDDWIGVVDELESQIEVFKNIYGKDAFELAEKIEKENREKAQSNK